jgi:hypothetical protein
VIGRIARFFVDIFDLGWVAFGQTPGAFGQQQPQQQQPQQQPAANPMFGGFGTNTSTTPTTGFGTTGGWPQDIMYQSTSNSHSSQAEHSVRIPQTQRVCSAPPNLPQVLVRPERLVQLGLGPRPALPPQVHLVSRAQAPQELLEETQVFSAQSLRSERVSIFPGLS